MLRRDGTHDRFRCGGHHQGQRGCAPDLGDGLDYVFVDTAACAAAPRSPTVWNATPSTPPSSPAASAYVTLLTLDATEGVSQQDKRLMDMLNTRKIPFMVVINKCDLVSPR